MKSSAIIDIFKGLRGHIETMKMPKDGLEEVLATTSDTYEELKERLSPGLFALHQKFINALEKSWSAEVEYYFAEGFKLGLHIGIECAEE